MIFCDDIEDYTKSASSVLTMTSNEVKDFTEYRVAILREFHSEYSEMVKQRRDDLGVPENEKDENVVFYLWVQTNMPCFWEYRQRNGSITNGIPAIDEIANSYRMSGTTDVANQHLEFFKTLTDRELSYIIGVFYDIINPLFDEIYS